MSRTLTHSITNTRPEMRKASLGQDYLYNQPPMASNPFPFDTNYQMSGPPYMRPIKQTGDNLPFDDQSFASQISQADENFSNLRPFSLKRPFSRISMETYTSDSISEARKELTDNSKAKINQDPQLLSFVRLPDTHTLIDSQERVQRINLTAQLHGMFFLSELDSTAGDTVRTSPELTCYRRNLFQISGIVLIPRSDLFYVNESGEKVALISMEVKISAIESVDKNTVKLIVIPWKTPPPNSPDIASGHEREPSAIPLTAYKPSAMSRCDISNCNNGSSMFCSPIAYRRLQFRIATANNGRRRELQQHFTLHLTIVGTLADGSQLNVCETSTAPIVVRGRSPRNFQARKGIPLVGSSSSRGNPPELQMAMNLMSSNAISDNRTKEAMHERAETTFEIPKSSFNLDSSKIVGSPSLIRLASYPLWDTVQPLEYHPSPNNHPSPFLPIETYPHPPKSALDLTPSVSSTESLSSSSMRTPFLSYHPLSAPLISDQSHFYDENHRIIKSPRCSGLIDPVSPTSYLETGCCYSQQLDAGIFMNSTQVVNSFSPSDSTHWSAGGGTPSLHDNSVPILQPYEKPCASEAERIIPQLSETNT